jgi:hypothetical protein
MTTTPEPEPSEREALARLTAYLDEMDRVDAANLRLHYADDVHGINDFRLYRSDIRTALAARPAPVVSAEAVEAAALLIHNRRNHNQDTSPGYCGGLRADEIGRVREVLAALGITVTDTPAADDEGGQGR